VQPRGTVGIDPSAQGERYGQLLSADARRQHTQRLGEVGRVGKRGVGSISAQVTEVVDASSSRWI
jgi:hypothetical protein